jgi:DNA polymerase-1
VLQSIGNRTGRERNNRANEAQASRPPRAMVLSTGEDLPNTRTASTLSRTLVVRVEEGDVNIHGDGGIVDVAQERPLHQIAMRSYLAHVAGHYEKRVTQITNYALFWAQDYDDLRDAAQGAHARTAPSIALLIAAAESYLDYAAKLGAITVDHQKMVRHSVIEWMTSLAAKQVDYSGERSGASPADRWITAISALLMSGRATLAARMPIPGEDGASTAADMGLDGVGWVDERYIYLSPDISWNAVRTFYDREWPYNKNEVHRQLAERGIIERAAGPENGPQTQRIARRVRLGGTQHPLLWIPRRWFEDALRKQHRGEGDASGMSTEE